MKGLILLLASTGFGCAPLMASEGVRPSAATPAPTVIEPPAGAACHYDRIRDLTTCATNDVTVEGAGLDAVHVSFDFACKGANACRPEAIDIALGSISSDWRWLRDHDEITLLIDTERLRLAVDYRNEVGDGFVTETAFASLTPEQFEKVASAEHAEGELGVTEFILPPKAIEAARLLAAKIPK